MARDWYGMIRRGVRKPPKIIAQRLADEARAELERVRAPLRARRFDDAALLQKLCTADINQLWECLGQREFATHVAPMDRESLERICPGEAKRVLEAADRALHHKVDLLGSGDVELGERIDWQRDYKTGFRWPQAYFRSIDYNNPERPSDVKFPWEVSRLQWLIPAGQAYLLTGDERYARGVRAVLEQWISDNPYAGSVNWACTMEVALRILSWGWLFHAFKWSAAWSEANFRSRFLRAMYLHADFTERNLERSDVNGNHYTADAAGLVFAGLFFGTGKDAERWARSGWAILADELPKQVYPDGVDFEASTAYHRLVFELFLYPALYRRRFNLAVSDLYWARLFAMARFVEAYTQPDGSAPLWGDADDGRALPFGGQPINDHRYLIGLLAASVTSSTELRRMFSGPRSEVLWALGPEVADKLPETDTPEAEPVSVAFAQGGCFIMRNRRDHIFIDCGPVGLAGRGGHGHNDCLSFEAVLDGVKLVTDCGAYVYTASFEERNRFRSTAYHNTPRIDGEEINRFVRPDYLWSFRYDARPNVRTWYSDKGRTVFEGSHTGYARIGKEPVRTVILDHSAHSLKVQDLIVGEGVHEVEVPLHLAPNVLPEFRGDRQLLLRAGISSFLLRWKGPPGCAVTIETGRMSPSYGITVPIWRLVWRFQVRLPATVEICVCSERSIQ